MAFAGASGRILLQEATMLCSLFQRSAFQGTRRVWSNGRVLLFSRLRQVRWATQTAQSSNFAGATELNDYDDKKATTAPVIYQGSMSAPLRGVKLLSASSFFIAVVGAPVLTLLTNPELSMLMKGALSTTMIVLSASTTFALHWIASPYVHKLVWIPGSNVIDVQMLSWMAITTRRKIKLSDVETPHTQHPLVTFAANNKYYYVDTDNFPSRVLLDLLVPEKLAQPVARPYESDDE